VLSVTTATRPMTRGSLSRLDSRRGGEETRVEVEKKRVIEARLDARLEELARLRAAMRRSSAGMRDSELAHVDNHPGDLAGELLEEEIEQTEEIFIEEGERRIPQARLEAVPEAVRCVGCQRRFEGRHRQQTRV
jgi:RNA polymerase-binding transcription factor DksA